MTQALIKARELLADPTHWTKQTNAKDAHGNQVCVRDPKASCWCSLGALDYAGAEFEDTELVYAALPGWAENSIAEFNDADTTTHADVLALFDRAIGVSA